MRGCRLALLLTGCLVFSGSAAAQNFGVTGDWGGVRSDLAASGVSLRADVTGYGNALLAGDGRKTADAFGRYDMFADIETSKMGLSLGTGLHVHAEGRFGDGRANFGGQLLPSFTGAALPQGGEGIAATSIYLTQPLASNAVLMIGKINAVDLLAGDPVFGGWATQRFQNIVFVAPPSGVVPPTIMGAIAVIKTNPISMTLMVFDPEDRTRDYWVDGLFSTGVNISVNGTWGGRIAGRATSVGVTATVSTKRGPDFSSILPPPGLFTNDRKGSFNIAATFTHRLAESAAVKGKGLDFVLKAAIADGNPNIIQSSIIIGLAGQGMIPGRPDDSFGIGAFAYNFSNALQSRVNPLLDFNDEQGLEAWYNLALTRWWKLGADLQLINPATGRNDVAVTGGLRTSIAF